MQESLAIGVENKNEADVITDNNIISDAPQASNPLPEMDIITERQDNRNTLIEEHTAENVERTGQSESKDSGIETNNSEYSSNINHSNNSTEGSSVPNTEHNDQSSDIKLENKPNATGSTPTEWSRPSKTDIYGRVPTKEPKYPISCPTCGRIISVSRFAAHLEKCLGISGRG
jgi:hypothetical protein